MVMFTAEQLRAIGEWANDNFSADVHMVLHPNYIAVNEDGEETIYRTAEIFDEY